MGAAAGVGRAIQGVANSPKVQTLGQGKGNAPIRPTVPPQGGKTAAPGTILNPNNPNNVPMAGGKAAGAVQPGQPQSPYTPIGAQGGKGGTSNVPGYAQPYVNALNPQAQQPQVPAQGGKGRDFGPNVFPGPQVQQPLQPFGPGSAGPGVLMQPQVLPQQPGQVPAQGGKGTSRQDYDRMMALTSYGPGGAPTYEQFVQQRTAPQMPQVMPMKPGLMPQDQMLTSPGQSKADAYKAYLYNAQQPNFGNTGGPGKPAPFPAQVMPRPAPQVMPAQSRPTNMAPQGLAQIQQMLAGQQLNPGRPAPAPGLNGVPGNQNPLYFGPGRK
jgi:hypothetical protein